jgi:RNA polymerase sigma-70 factor (ECF subfamily)
VIRAGQTDGAGATEALETLCQTYWPPLYAFVRRAGHSPHTAQDLTQEFFSRLLESSLVGSAEQEKGRFRSYLLACLKNFLANEWKHSQRQKRGGSQAHFSLDAPWAEGRYEPELADHFTPEKAYERRWAETLLQRVLDLLQAEWEHKESSRHFEDLKPFLLHDNGSVRFADVASRLGVTEASLKWAVHTLRKRYREIFREQIAQTVSRAEDIDDEIRHLFSVLAD